MTHPAAVPWLRHLRTDARGIPVPFVNRWGRDDAAVRVEVRHDPNVGHRAIYQLDADEAVPDFTRQNMQRQRACAAGGLCQVCGRRIPWAKRRLVVGEIGVERIALHGRPVDVVVEPWLDPTCAELAVRFCPALIRRSRSDVLRVLPVTSQRLVQVVLSAGWHEGSEDATKENPAIMWAKLALLAPVQALPRGEF